MGIMIYVVGDKHVADNRCSEVAQWWSTRLLTDRLWVRVPPLEPIRRGGGIGRRTGLKIPRSLPIVPVRPRSPAPFEPDGQREDEVKRLRFLVRVISFFGHFSEKRRELNIAGWSSWQLVGLITRRSQVQILSPQPRFNPKSIRLRVFQRPEDHKAVGDKMGGKKCGYVLSAIENSKM